MGKALIFLALLGAAACDRPTAAVPPPVPPSPAPPPPPPPTPGQLVVAWAGTSQSYAAAIMFEIRGGTIRTISNPDPNLYLQADQPADSTSARIVLAGHIGTQDLAVLEVPDVNAIASYQPTLLSAAGPDGELYALAGYTLRIYKREP